MKTENKQKLINILRKELNREPTATEIGNAETDHNLIAKLMIDLVEDQQEKTQANTAKIESIDNKVKLIK